MDMRCGLGLHNDATDAFGGYSPTCVRCGGPSWNGPTLGARGVLMMIAGWAVWFVGLFAPLGYTAQVSAFVGGVVLIWIGGLMSGAQRRQRRGLRGPVPPGLNAGPDVPVGWWDCPTCGRVRLEPHPRQPLLRCSNCKEHRR